MTIREECAAALGSPNVRAFLRLIREGESSQTDDAYRMIVGGGLFDDFADHPRKYVNLPSLGVTSSAAGAYQFLARTWDECRNMLGLEDFSPANQDLAAVFLIRRRGALQVLLDGDIEEAIKRCAKEWASLPGSPYGQPTLTLDRALAVYRRFHEPEQRVEAIPPGEAPDWPPKEKPMAPIIAAILPSLIESIPKLGKVFGSGSEVADRNIKAAEVVVEAVKAATGAVNAQDAAEKIKASPEARAAAEKAIDAIWYELTEAGGGGIDGARKADAAARNGGGFWLSPSFWVTVLLLPLVYLVVGSVVGLWGAEWPSDVRAAIATAVVSLIVGGAAGYYWGQTTSRNRTAP